MRALLRGLVAVLTTATKLFTVVAGVVYVSLLIVLVRGELTPSVVGVSFILLVVLAGILWCSNRIALTPATPVAPGSRLVRRGLRLLAGLQIALGLFLGLAAVANVYPHVTPGVWPRSDTGLVALALLPGAAGLACVGGALWCVTRVAYPQVPPAGAIPTPVPPGDRAPELPREQPSEVRPERTYLRALAGTQVGASVVLTISSAAAAGFFHGNAGRPAVATIWAAAAPVFALLALVGLYLFHTAGAVLPTPAAPRRVFRPVRLALRVVAAVQMGVGALVVVAGVLFAGDRLLLGSWRDAGTALVALAVAFVALVVMCLGGLLWCAVRLAYPEGWDEE